MLKKTSFKMFAIVLILGMLFTATAPIRTIAQSTDPQGSVTVDPQVYQEIEADGSTSYWIEFRDKPDLSKAYTMDWSERGWFVYEQLSKTANASQQNVVNYLNDSNVKFKSYWIKNTILVESSGIDVLNGLLSFPEIESIQPRKEYILYEPDTSAAVMDNGLNAIEPNISHVNADDAWAMGYTGEGLVVASIDTGVRYTHDALTGQYRGNDGGSYSHDYNWWDPYGDHDVPADDNGHGTHTMGTMVGDDGGANQIGMAPGADWIACRGCNTSSCADNALIECAEFVAAPTDSDGLNPDPDMRPNVVNNSWGDCGQSYDDWYADVINAWHAVGTYPVFSNGNASNCGYPSPPGLNTVGNPARSGNVSGVGASGTDNGQYATFSNWGPTDNPDTVNPTDGFATMKPQVIAPGTSIRSSTPGSDSDYQDGWSGTSMAAPHVSGLVALIWQAAPCLVGDYATTENLIEETAVDIVYDDGSGDTPTNFPNFATGWGEIDALAAVELAAGLCGDSTLQGTVTDILTLEPLPGAMVEITSSTDPDNNRKVYTNASGTYSAAVYGDTYDVTVSKFGYSSMTVTGVVVESEATVTQDFALDELDTALVSGTVFDGGIEGSVSHGYPLYASLTFAAPGFSETFYTDPFTGEYEVELYLGQEYAVSVAGVPMGYETLVDTFTPDTNPDTQDYTLFMPAGTCSAPGYAPDYDFFWNFEQDDGGFVTGGTTSFAWGDFTNGPGEGHSGTKGLATNPSGNYSAYELGWIESPAIDLSSYGTDTPALQWWDWKHIESANYDWARLDVTKDGGVTWDVVWGPVSGVSDTAYNQQTVALDPSYNVADFQFRFYFKSDGSVQYEGWYIDDVSIIEMPIPAPTEVFATDFDTDDGGFVVSGANATWEWGEPTTGPESAYSDPNVWATNLAGNYNNYEASYLTSPVIDLSSYSGLAPTLSFVHWMDSEGNTYDWGAIEVTKDGGATWDTAWEKFGDVLSWTPKSIQLDPSYAVSDFRFRFFMRSDSSVNYPGWYIDDVAVTVAEPVVIAPDCVAIAGGIVAGFVYDDNTDLPLIGADVVSLDVATQTFELIDDPVNGGLYWVFQPTTTDPEEVDFTASMVNYSDDVQTVSVVQDAVTQQDFYLGTGHLLFDPTSFEVTMGMEDAPHDETLTISNDGSGSADFELFEVDKGFTPLTLYKGIGVKKQDVAADEIVLAASNSSKETKPNLTSSMPNADVELILDDGTVENDIGIGGTSEFIFLNRFTPDPSAFPFTLNEIQVYFDDTVTAGDEIVLAIYENTSGNTDPAVGSNLLASIPTTVQVASSWNNYSLTEGVLMSGPGDVLIGVVAMETPGVSYFPAAIDTSTTQQRSWAGWWSSSPPPSDLALPPDESWLLIDDAGFPGNWMVRGMGSAGGGDVVWLSEEPVSGTVPSEGSVEVTLTFDPSLVEQPGDFTAELLTQHNTPYVYENIDVTLHLTRPATWGTLKGTVYSLEACDLNPMPVEGATIEIYDDSGTLVANLTSGPDGEYSWSIIAGTYDIEVSLDGYETMIVEDLELAEDSDLVTDVELRLLAPCLTVDPESMEQWLGPDQTETQVLSLINTGAGEAGFEIQESEAITTETLLSEGFEGGVMPPAGGWETVHNGDTTREWMLVDAVRYPWLVYEGDYSAWVNGDYASSDEWLVSPVMDVTGKLDLELTFMAISDTLWPGATMKLWVTDATGAPLTVDPLWDLIRDEYWSTAEYRMVTVDLSAFDDYGNIRVAWQYVGFGGQSFGLDNIEIGATIDIFSVFDAPMTGKTPSYTYTPENDVMGADQSKQVQVAGTAGEYVPMDTMIDESFEDAFPPAGWTQEINNTYTWEQYDYNPHTGSYYAHVVYDPELNQQDEWLLTPELNLSEGTLSVWSLGSIYWCRDTYDNCDGNVWLVIGDVGGGDDIFVKNLDEDWVDNWLWAESTIDLAPYLPGMPFRIGFQYIGLDGAEVAIDDVILDGVAGEAFDIPWLSEDPVIGTVPADSTLDVDVTFDSTGLAYGDYYGMLQVKNTPAPAINVPVALHVIPAPEAFDQSLTTQEDVPLDITLTAVDPEGDPLTYLIVDEPSHGTLEYEAGELPALTYVPDEDYYGMDSFTFKANDGVVDSNVATITIEVTSVNYQPKAMDDYYRVDENTDLVVPAPGVLENDSDEDPLDVLVADLLDEPEHGVVVLNEDGSFTYTPDTDFLGEDSFTYNLLGLPPEITGEYVDSATVYITVNTIPVADDQNLSTDEDIPLDITLTASYLTPGPVVWTIVTPPSSGSLSGTAPNLVYTPDLDWYGTDSFTFSVNDGQYESNVATITIEVKPVNDEPQATDDYYEVDQDDILIVDAPGVLDNDSDVDPTDVFNAEFKTNPQHGYLELNPDGSFKYIPEPGFFGMDSFEYYMLSTPGIASELSDWATVYITVHPKAKIFLPLIIGFDPCPWHWCP